MLVTDEKGLTKRLDQLNQNLEKICSTIEGCSVMLSLSCLCVAASGEYQAVDENGSPTQSLEDLLKLFGIFFKDAIVKGYKENNQESAGDNNG